MREILFYLALAGSLIAFFYKCESEPESKIPKEEKLYVFPFKSEVDALNITRETIYVESEKCSDNVKKMIRSEVNPLSANRLIQMGEDMHREYVLQNFSLVQHERKSWLIEIVDRMKPHLVEYLFPYNIYVFDSPYFNAFTIPGGNLYFSTGLLNAVSTKDELAFVVGHEFGHNENDHTKEGARLCVYRERLQKKNIWYRMQAGLTNWLSSSCGKSDELESDIASIYLMHQAGYDVESAISSIDLLRKYGTPKPDNAWDIFVWELFGTHPWSEDRAEHVKRYLQESRIHIKCEEVFQDRAGVVITKKSPLNIRKYPMQRTASIAQIPKGATVEVICDCIQQEWRDGKDWLYIEYVAPDSKYRGWVNKKYIKYQ